MEQGLSLGIEDFFIATPETQQTDNMVRLSRGQMQDPFSDTACDVRERVGEVFFEFLQECALNPTVMGLGLRRDDDQYSPVLSVIPIFSSMPKPGEPFTEEYQAFRDSMSKLVSRMIINKSRIHIRQIVDVSGFSTIEKAAENLRKPAVPAPNPTGDPFFPFFDAFAKHATTGNIIGFVE